MGHINLFLMDYSHKGVFIRYNQKKALLIPNLDTVLTTFNEPNISSLLNAIPRHHPVNHLILPCLHVQISIPEIK